MVRRKLSKETTELIEDISLKDARSIYKKNEEEHKALVVSLDQVVQRLKQLSKVNLFLIDKFGINKLINEDG